MSRPPARPRGLRLPARCTAAALGGALWGLAFGITPRPWLGFVGLAALLALLSAPRLSRRGAALVGFVHGLVAWLVSIPWIVPTVAEFGRQPRWLAVIFLLLLASYLAAFHAAFAALVAPVWRSGRWGAALWGPAALWVALEWLRTHLFSGFPWNPAAHAWTDLPGALAAAAWIGAYGVSFLLVLANAAIASSLRRGEGGRRGERWREAGAGLLVVIAILGAAAWWQRGGEASEVGEAGAGSESIDVRIVQPNIPNLVEIDWPTVFANYRGLLELSRAACAEGALVIWPESAAWPYVLARDEALREDVAALAASGCGILLNSAHADGDDWYNSAYLVAPGAGGSPQRYDKRHLVPFGEYVPLGELMPWVRGLARAAGSFRPADELALLRWRSAELGVAICFEIVFPEEVADLTRAGASVLVTITNDAWYGDTAAPRQHFRAARWRAAESRRSVLRAAVTGISGVIGPDGRVLQRLGVGERDVLRARVTPRHGLSFYDRMPWLVPLVCSLAGLFAIFLGRRGQPVRGPPSEHYRPESDPS